MLCGMDKGLQRKWLVTQAICKLTAVSLLRRSDKKETVVEFRPCALISHTGVIWAWLDKEFLCEIG